jgi:hypothetical protein
MRLNKLLVAFRSKSRKNDRLLGLILPRIEQLEERCTPAGVSLIQNVALPGANTAWDFSKAPFIASPVVYDLDGDGQDEVIVTGGDGNLYAYKENTSTGNLVQEKEYFTGPFGQVNGAPVPIQSTPIVVNLPSGLAVFAANAQGWVFGWNAVTGFIIPGRGPEKPPTRATRLRMAFLGALPRATSKTTAIRISSCPPSITR